MLLVNDGTLPVTLQTTRRMAVIGELARTPRYQGAGSSAVNPTRVVSGLEALTRRAETVGATARGGIRGRMADLLSDETGQDSVLDVPMQSFLEFPGVPLTADDAQRLVTETA